MFAISCLNSIQALASVSLKASSHSIRSLPYYIGSSVVMAIVLLYDAALAIGRTYHILLSATLTQNKSACVFTCDSRCLISSSMAREVQNRTEVGVKYKTLYCFGDSRWDNLLLTVLTLDR